MSRQQQQQQQQRNKQTDKNNGQKTQQHIASGLLMLTPIQVNPKLFQGPKPNWKRYRTIRFLNNATETKPWTTIMKSPAWWNQHWRTTAAAVPPTKAVICFHEGYISNTFLRLGRSLKSRVVVFTSSSFSSFCFHLPAAMRKSTKSNVALPAMFISPCARAQSSWEVVGLIFVRTGTSWKVGFQFPTVVVIVFIFSSFFLVWSNSEFNSWRKCNA